MPKQIIRVYALVILIVALLLYSFSSLYEILFEEHDRYLIAVDQLFEQYTQGGVPQLSSISLAQVDFPEDLQSSLIQGNTVAVTNEQNDLFFYKKDENLVLVLGPYSRDVELPNSHSDYFLILFYLALALAFLLVFYPIARDIVKLQRAAKYFSKKQLPISNNLKKTSIVYPIAESMADTSNRLVELISMQKDLGNTVAHEIRTPLSRMRFTLKSIMPLIPEKQNERMLKDIEEINTLASDYLAFSRLEQNEHSIDIQYQSITNLMFVLEDNFDVFQHKCAITFLYQNQHCHYDLHLMTIACQNLIMNALRYAKSKILVDISFAKNICCISVKDNGRGLQGKPEKIINAFSRRAKDKYDFGFGLGLYITSQIAIKHNGQLFISNDKTLKGACCEISFPVKGKL